MAGITTSHTGMRTKLVDIIENSPATAHESIEVTKGLRNVVGWLKQV